MKRVLEKSAILILSFLLTLISLNLTACEKLSVLDFTAFSSPSHIEVYDGDISNGAKSKILSVISDLESEFSEGENSLISKINKGRAGAYDISENFINLFTIAEKCYDLTDGNFDPTVLPLIKAWGFGEDYPVKNFTPPTDFEINSIIDSGIIGLNNIKAENGKLIKEKDETSLDFGGIIKGYAVDKISEILKKDGHDTGYINLGSSSLYIFSAPSLGIKHPFKAESIISVKLSGESGLAVSTSGDYERFYINDGIKYSHVISPVTGCPITSEVHSVTLIGKDCGVLDGLSTGLLLLDKNDLIATVKALLSDESLDIRYFFAVISDGEKGQILTNKKQGEDFTLLDDSYSVIGI